MGILFATLMTPLLVVTVFGKIIGIQDSVSDTIASLGLAAIFISLFFAHEFLFKKVKK